jgi:hypothetical protein
MVAMRMHAEGSLGCVIRMFHIASAATSEPASGVHKPANKSSPIVMANTPNATNWVDGPCCSLADPWITRQDPATSRINKRPAPGQPGAKVENSRRKYPPDNPTDYRIDEFAESP